MFPAGSFTPVTIAPSAAVSAPKGVMVYGPSVAGGGSVPGEPLKAMHDEPVQLIVAETVWPLDELVVCWSLMSVVWFALQFPDVVQSPCTPFVWVAPSSASWVEVCVTTNSL